MSVGFNIRFNFKHFICKRMTKRKYFKTLQTGEGMRNGFFILQPIYFQILCNIGYI